MSARARKTEPKERRKLRLFRKRLGSKFSEGARQLWLIAVLERGLTQAAIRDALGKSNGVICRWLFGDKRPSGDERSGIEKVFGIASSLWSAKPAKPFVLPKVLPAARVTPITAARRVSPAARTRSRVRPRAVAA